MCNEIEVGDWVRFYQNGKLVIGQVEYIREGKFTGEKEYHTDIGRTTHILEYRHKRW